MISKNCFELSFLEERGRELHVSDLRNLEKCILALELTARLQQGGLDFIFKGGTSLLLHCDPPRRLSIDVDIVSLEPLERFQEVLKSVVRDVPFFRWEHQELRDREAPPTKHFRAHYISAINDEEDSVQLDVITTENAYADVVELPIRTSFLEMDEETRVQVPSASALLADKVAAFAPTTIGFPYDPIDLRTGEPQEPRPIKVVKHLFDIGELAGLATDTPTFISTYAKIHEEQVQFRGGDYSIADTVADTQRASYHVCRIQGTRPDAGSEENRRHRTLLRSGLSAIKGHLFSDNFQTADSQLAAAKAALAAQIIVSRAQEFDLPSFLAAEPDFGILRDAELTGDWEHISAPLKKGNIEAFRIWHQAQQLRENHD